MKSSQDLATRDSTGVAARRRCQTFRWNGLVASVRGVALQDRPMAELDAICQTEQALSTIDTLNAELTTLVVARSLNFGITERIWQAKLVFGNKIPQWICIDLQRIYEQYSLLQLSSRRTAGQFMPTQCVAFVLSLKKF